MGNMFWLLDEKEHTLLKKSIIMKEDQGRTRVKVLDQGRRRTKVLERDFYCSKVIHNGSFFILFVLKHGEEKVENVVINRRIRR